MHLQVCGWDKKEENTRVRSLASSGVAWRGMVRRGDGHGRTTCAWIVRQNPAQSLTDSRPPFTVYFYYESVSNMFW
jgi:hypothetical protein